MKVRAGFLAIVVALAALATGCSVDDASHDSAKLLGVISADRHRLDVFDTGGTPLRTIEFGDSQISFTERRFGSKVVSLVETATGTDVEVIDLATGARLNAYSDGQSEFHFFDTGRFERWLSIQELGFGGEKVVVDLDAFEVVQSPLIEFHLPWVSADRTGELYRLWVDGSGDGFVWIDIESGQEVRLDESVGGVSMSPSGDRLFVGHAGEQGADPDLVQWTVRTMDEEVAAASLSEVSAAYWLDEERMIFDVRDGAPDYPRHVVNAFTGEVELTVGGSPFNWFNGRGRFLPAIEDDQLVAVDPDTGERHLAFSEGHELASFHELTSFRRINDRFSWFGEDGGSGWTLDGETGVISEWKIAATDGTDPKTSDDYVAAVLSPSADYALFPFGTAHRIFRDGTVDQLATNVVSGSICNDGLTVLVRHEDGPSSPLVAEAFTADSTSLAISFGTAADAVCIG